MNSFFRIIQRPLFYFRNKLSPRQFLILSSVLVGLSSGLAAVALKAVVHTLTYHVTSVTGRYDDYMLFAICPLIGLVLTVVIVRFIIKERPRKGSAEIAYAIVKKSSIISPHETYSHLITSAVTVGFGGSVGLESPMVSTGSAIGANYGGYWNLSYKERTVLLGCGAAAGIAAAFNSPIAGVLFAVEVLLIDISVAAFIPLIIAAACGALISKMVLSEGVVISFSLQQPFNYYNVPFYILLGLLCGLVSIYYARAFTFVETKLAVINNIWAKAIAGGLMLFILMLLFPPLFGEGYGTIKALANLDMYALVVNNPLKPFLNNQTEVLIFLGCMIFLKSIAAAITLNSGGNGGNFGPSLFVGAYLGFVFSRVVNVLGIGQIPESNFTLVAMAGILSGVFYAPLTAIFLIAEITGGYELMIPLMIVSSLSIVIVHIFEPISMEGKKLSAILKFSVETRDRFLLSKMDLSELIETNFVVVHPEEDLRSLIRSISSSSRNQFPVLDENEKLIGIIFMDHVRKVIFDPARDESLRVKQLMSPPAAVIEKNENIHSVLQKFDHTKLWNLPVSENGKYVGFLSKSSILSRYRSEMLESL
jgi:chloride channel protein, CIC family